jgi:hypothetical protein
MAFPTNYTPPWISYMTSHNPADIVSSPEVADAIGLKVDATDGQALNPTIEGGTLTGTDITGSVATISGSQVPLETAVAQLFLAYVTANPPFFSQVMSVWLNNLPAAPVATPTWWNNGGMPSYS